MKKQLVSTVLAFAALVTVCSAGAQVTNTINPGDLVLGFESSLGQGVTQNLLIDLGQEANFNSINLNANADLNTIFGTNWYSSGFVSYGIFSIDANNTVYATSVGTGFPRKSSGALATAISDFSTLSSQYTVNYNNSNALTVGVSELATSGGALQSGTWSYYSPSTTPFATYNKSLESIVGTAMTLYMMPVGNSGVGTAVGQINVASDGTISAVPEPSTYALFGLGALVLVIAYRRNRSRTA